MRYFLFMLLLCAATCGYAQEEDTTAVVIKQGDPAIRKLPSRNENEFTEVAPENIPSSVKKTLEAPKYKGWMNSTLYYDTKMQRYWIELCKENKPVRYFFDKNGKPATGE